MSKDSGKPGGGSAEGDSADLKQQRDQFLQAFAKGSKVTEEFIQEYQRLQERMRELEAENASLRAKVEADTAIRELLDKIQQLEGEKRDLMSRFEEAEAVSERFSERFHEVEVEFANLANLFVASNQLHSSLSPRGVARRIKEVMAQLVGAEAYCIFLANHEETELVPIASEGVPGNKLINLRVDDRRVADVFQDGATYVNEDSDPSRGTVEQPAAVVPLVVDERVVGVIAIFSTLSQKSKFDTTDFELFKLLGQHAAAALVSAGLFVAAQRKIPGLEAFIDLSV